MKLGAYHLDGNQSKYKQCHIPERLGLKAEKTDV